MASPSGIARILCFYGFLGSDKLGNYSILLSFHCSGSNWGHSFSITLFTPVYLVLMNHYVDLFTYQVGTKTARSNE